MELIVEGIKAGIENAREKGVKLGGKEANRLLKEKAHEWYRFGGKHHERDYSSNGFSTSDNL